MVENQAARGPEQDLPQQALQRMLTGSWVSQAIYAAAKLGIADLLDEGPKRSDELARLTNTRPGPLYRLLRTLASLGIFEEVEPHRFRLTPLAEQLKSGIPGSQRALAIMMGEEHFRAWGEIIYSLQTGQPAFDKIYGQPVFEYLSGHPEAAAVFDGAMTGIHSRETEAMIDAYDFSRFKVLADVGGGNGSLLRAVLQRHPALHGLLFDLGHVIDRARPAFREAGLESRCRFVAGSFFESVPAGADAYLMRHIIHDWDDQRALPILRNCGAAMRPQARLLLVENVIPAGNEPCFGKLLDLTMLVMPGGLERTAEEYDRLLAAAGLRLERIVPTKSEISVIEAAPA